MPTDAWSPTQYNKFRQERMLPFVDLLGLIRPCEGMRVLDLGCGTGELTAMLAEHLPGSTVVGVDSSRAMLGEAEPRSSERVSFRLGDIRQVEDFGTFDLVFSNAALQWVPDNEGLMRRLLSALKPGAQLAVQVPRNEGHPSHQVTPEVASEPPFRELLGGYVRRTEVLALERYAELLHAHGFGEAVCLEKIYGHELARSSDVVEWVKGTQLTAYLSRLDAEHQRLFLDVYRDRLLREIGHHAPYFYPFRRMLFWGRKSS